MAFLGNFMRAAQKITHAERCMVVDANLKVMETVNIDPATLEAPEFMDFAMECLREACETKEAVITNNVITDPSEAPTTNTNFANLRVVVALPIAGHGGIYMDQHIRNGIMPKEMVDRIMRLAEELMQTGQESLSPAEMTRMYQEMGL